MPAACACSSPKPCVWSFVFTTSKGVVRAPATAPAMPPEMRYVDRECLPLGLRTFEWLVEAHHQRAEGHVHGERCRQRSAGSRPRPACAGQCHPER